MADRRERNGLLNNGRGHAPLAPGRAQLVRDILRLATERNWQRGYHVTEQELVVACSVSRSPIRAALKVLEQRGILQARPNQGYILTQSKRQLERTRIEVPRTADETLYLKIMEDRITGALPEVMTQADLLRLYATNRTQLAGLLARMTNEGIIARLKGHGWRFLPTLSGPQSTRASYEFRLVIEPALLLLPAFAVDQAALQQLRLDHLKLVAQAERGRSLDRGSTYDLDASFHEKIAGFSGNAFLLQAIQQHNRLRRLAEYKGYSRLERVRAWAGEHLAILDALQRGRFKRASERMRQHLSNAQDAIHVAKP
jgi:DNA-binding GntR family transcriptional regulator